MKLPDALLLVFGGFLALILFLIFYMTRYTASGSSISCWCEALRVFLILSGVLILLSVVLCIWRIRYSQFIKNLVLCCATLFFLFLVLELVFMFIAYPFGNDASLASRIWMRRHWKVNSSGFRDIEFDQNQDTAKTNIFVLGDSFVAGAGIKDPSCRFTDILRKRISDQYCLYNLGKNGADTEEELDLISEFPVKPDILILCHYVNDIEYMESEMAASNNHPAVHGNTGKEFTGKPNRMMKLFVLARAADNAGKKIINFLRPVIDNSFFLNFFYYKFKGGLSMMLFDFLNISPEEKLALISRYIKHKKLDQLNMYLDKELMSVHLKTLSKFIEWSGKHGVKLIIVLFPRLNDIYMDFTQKHINLPMEAFFKSRQVPVVNTYNFLKKIPQDERTVNRVDVHPSVKSNRLIAGSLYRILVKQ